VLFNAFLRADPRTGEETVEAIIRDVTRQRHSDEALQNERRLLRLLIDNLPDPVYVKDTWGRKVLVNRAYQQAEEAGQRYKGSSPREGQDIPEGTFLSGTDDEALIRSGESVINREECLPDQDGQEKWFLTSKIPLRETDGSVNGLIGISRDVTERKRLEERLTRMAHYDILTGLPSRTLFLERATIGLAQARRSGALCAVFFIDLDHFKTVNDTLGHSVGDELLKDTAAKLMACVRDCDTVARLGGDEFTIFLPGLEQVNKAYAIAERIRSQFNVPRLIAGNELFITASVGIAMCPEDGENMETLMKNADTAMYGAKDAGRNTYCFFDRLMNQRAVDDMDIKRRLRTAVSRGEFAVFYQPIVRMKDGCIRGFEALLRWFPARDRIVMPDEFIPAAEESGLIIPIGEWVLRRSCLFGQRLINEGHGKLIMSVNISVAQLRHKEFVDTVRSALAESGFPASCLEIEVTESLFIGAMDVALDVLSTIRSLGVSVSLDDFGTGYSSLGHLLNLPIKNIKIDRVFIKEIIKRDEDSDLTPSIISLAHKLKFSVVAEGVESPAQFERLARHSCDFYQGFLFSKPLAEKDLLRFLKSYKASPPAMDPGARAG
jgi:polar amino acid transport system substrate-binding protein